MRMFSYDPGEAKMGLSKDKVEWWCPRAAGKGDEDNRSTTIVSMWVGGNVP